MIKNFGGSWIIIHVIYDAVFGSIFTRSKENVIENFNFQGENQ